MTLPGAGRWLSKPTNRPLSTLPRRRRRRNPENTCPPRTAAPEVPDDYSSIVTFTGCTICLRSFPAVSTMSDRAPGNRFDRNLELDGRCGLLCHFHLKIRLVVRKENFGDDILGQVLAGNRDDISALAVRPARR